MPVTVKYTVATVGPISTRNHSRRFGESTMVDVRIAYQKIRV
jgi:hypothetical protein